ncbi:MAG TPA: hypothetical protein VJV78_30305 [Polyangiales bacterium]|nr:hypothetical protein [Polyangiales bacterium]
MTTRTSIARAVALLSLCACQDGTTQTHVLLEVQVAQALAKRVTRVDVHGQKPGGSRDEGAGVSSAYKAGDALRFVLQPSAAQSRLQVRIVALSDGEVIASAVLRSRYRAAHGLHLKVEIGCEGERDLGEQTASETARELIDTCKFRVKELPMAGAGGAAGGGGMTVELMPAAGMGGRGEGGKSGSGTGGVGGAGAGGAGAGGAGAGAAGGAGMPAEPASSEPGCYSWRKVAKIAEVETLMPAAFVAGTEQRDGSAEEVKQFICLATPPGISGKLLGKASKWGCYIPVAGEAAATVTTDVEVLISRNSQPCLSWVALEAERAPAGTLLFGDGRVQACRVFHEGVGEEGHNTSGARVGQVRHEDGKWVCRYEFYSYLMRPTLTNQPAERTEVLE